MKTLMALSGLGMVLVLIGGPETGVAPWPPSSAQHSPATSTSLPRVSDNDVIQAYCVRCHNDRTLRGNMSLEHFDTERAPENAAVAEKVIRKLRAAMMPPPGVRRPAGDTLMALAEALERIVDAAAAANPTPGGRTFQRLNRAEYDRAIQELLALEVDAGRYLPLDTKSANFDNIADVQLLSPMLLDAYMNAASEIARLAVGDPDALPSTTTYTNSGYVSQWDRAEGAPFGTRGGISATHTFPADAEYVFNMAFEHTTTGGFFGGTTRGEQIELSIDGKRVQFLEVDRWMDVSDPNGVSMRSEPIFVRAGPHRVTAAFLRRSEGPLEDLVSPHDWSLTDRQIGVSGYGVTALAHLKDLAIVGPYGATGVSDTPARKRIFTCRPTSPDEARPCAQRIVTRLGTRAYRRPLSPDDVEGLMSFYDLGESDAGFERGVRCYNAAGAQQWELRSGQLVLGVDANAQHVACSSGKQVYCLTSDGQLLWREEVGPLRSLRFPRGGGALLVVTDGGVHCFEVNGQLLWQVEEEKFVETAAATASSPSLLFLALCPTIGASLRVVKSAFCEALLILTGVRKLLRTVLANDSFVFKRHVRSPLLWG